MVGGITLDLNMVQIFESDARKAVISKCLEREKTVTVVEFKFGEACINVPNIALGTSDQEITVSCKVRSHPVGLCGISDSGTLH